MSENVEAEEKTQDRTVTKIFLLLGALNLLTDYEVNQEEEEDQHRGTFFRAGIKSFLS